MFSTFQSQLEATVPVSSRHVRTTCHSCLAEKRGFHFRASELLSSPAGRAAGRWRDCLFGAPALAPSQQLPSQVHRKL